jgi:hypothetical protein
LETFLRFHEKARQIHPRRRTVRLFARARICHETVENANRAVARKM